jgi:hypothetical protein
MPYLDVCRIFLTSDLVDDYTELLRHEDDFWDALQRNERQGLSIRDWPRMLALNMGLGLRPTRASVANYRQFRGQGWDIQSHLVEDPEVARQNVDVIGQFFSRHPGEPRRYGNVEHLMVTNCRTEEIITGLLARLRTDGTDWENTYTVEYLARLILAGRLSVMDLLFMSNGTVRVRARDKETGRVNPMQGRSPGREPADPEFYPGDENIHEGRVQLQVHLIRLRPAAGKPAVETSALALYIPDDPLYNLQYVVRD